MTEPNPPSAWAEQVKKIVSDRAYTLNYDVGMQCRFMPVKSEQDAHTIEILMETTHLGHPFDLQWFVKYTNDEDDGIRFEVVAPPGEGGTLWDEHLGSLDRLRAEGLALPAFIRGYFVGRNAMSARAAAAPTG